MGLRQTAFSDVCGIIDEFKRRLPRLAGSSVGDRATSAGPLLADAEFMLARMSRRLREYCDFRDKVSVVLSRMGQLGAVDARPAEEAFALIHRALAAPDPDVDSLREAGERIRSVAVEMENRLRSYKDLALTLQKEYLAVRGPRPWLQPGQQTDSAVQGLRVRYQAWLPPEPHRVRLLEYLAASRAHVLPERPSDGEPVVEFEDGGAMPMSQVRWDEDVRNFRPASFGPEGIQA